MMTRRRKLGPLTVLIALSMLACNMERVLNPSLPTHTPPAATGAPDLPLPTALPTAISTPPPGARIEVGDWALFIGDWDAALTAYEAARRATNEHAIHGAAWLGTARAYYAAGDLAAALSALETYFGQYGDTPERGLAFSWQVKFMNPRSGTPKPRWLLVSILLPAQD